jgi:ADP-ribosylglycohydrolase
MAGAISGAYLGLEGLPEHLVGYVTDRGDWGYAELVRLAESCYNVAFGSDEKQAAALT